MEDNGEMDTKIFSLNRGRLNVFKRGFIRAKEFIKNHPGDVRYLFLIVPIVAVFLLVLALQNYQSLKSKAATYSATVSFQLSSATLPPETTFGVWVNAGAPVDFTAIEVDYDPTLVKLTRDVGLTNTMLTRIVTVTSMTEANTTGKIHMILGLDPSKVTTPPSGVFQVANLTFNALTTNPNVTTPVTFNKPVMQMVATDNSVFTLNTTNLTLTLNPVATPTPTTSPIPSPTSTAAPTPTPTPNINDSTPPTVSITSPANGSTVPTKGSLSIKASASDSSGIFKIMISVDGATSKTCSRGATSCQLNLSVNKISAGSHTISATAIDNSPNQNSSTTSIQIIK